MGNGLLVILALLMIYLAVTGKYTCVTAAARCVFGGAKLCECGAQQAAAGKPVAGQLPNAVEQGIRAGRTILGGIREAIDLAK